MRGLDYVRSLQENDIYFFDQEAGEKPIRFIEKFCHHFEGRFAGEPFILLDWERELTRALYGWKRRSDGLRRFRELYLISAKGAGKTPLLSAWGLFNLLEADEAGAHVISMASTWEQANLTFDCAKKFILQSPDLEAVADPKQFQIRGPDFAKWTTISGKPTGRSGPRPSCIIADEVHEWAHSTAKAYDLLCANLFKRAQPLLLVATNAGESKSSFAWTLHERALNVLAGKSENASLLPVIFEAPADLDWQSEAAARAANPSMPEVVSFEQVKAEQDKGEQRYRRLYLTQWVSSVEKWLDMTVFDARMEAFSPLKTGDLSLFVGLDFALEDDLCAQTNVYIGEHCYVDSHFWTPRATAERYIQQHGTPYREWNEAGDITYLEDPTVTPAARRRIADGIIELHKHHPITAVCYDRYKADDCISRLEEAGIVCVPIAQGYTVSPGCAEFSRRLKEGSITISPNQVMRFCAENAEITSDQRGNIWVVKPNAKGKYAGKREQKVDGISALVTALTEARKHTFTAKAKQWSGVVQAI